jgi:hypothetical protein
LSLEGVVPAACPSAVRHYGGGSASRRDLSYLVANNTNVTLTNGVATTSSYWSFETAADALTFTSLDIGYVDQCFVFWVSVIQCVGGQNVFNATGAGSNAFRVTWRDSACGLKIQWTSSTTNFAKQSMNYNEQ